MTTITSEIQRFNRLGATWWNPEGPMRPLHVQSDNTRTTLNGVRILN